MARYADLIDTVRDWTNRDESVLPDNVIKSALSYAADEAYRSLEIPPLEFTKHYVIRDYTKAPYIPVIKITTGEYATVSTNISGGTLDDEAAHPLLDVAIMRIPCDLVNFIYVRLKGKVTYPPIGSLVNGVAVTQDTYQNYIVVSAIGEPLISNPNSNYERLFNERVGLRNSYDNTVRESGNIWTRRGETIEATGRIREGDIFEVFYYRRLPDLNARTLLPNGLTLANAVADSTSYEIISEAAYNNLFHLDRATYTEIEGAYVRSTNEVDHWLKDQNERVLLFGALHRCYDYIDDAPNAEKYKQRYVDSLAELNAEERRRQISGGGMSSQYRNELL